MTTPLEVVGSDLVALRLISREQLEEALESLGSPSRDQLIDHFERIGVLTSLQTSKLDRGDTAGYFLGRFKILYKISAGTFARVYRGVDTTTGMTVAIKVLRSRHTMDPAQVKQFQREAKLTLQLYHPNIVRTLEVGTDDDTSQHYIAMEFIEGGNLKELLRIRKKFKPEEVVRLGKQMVEGLHYALQRGVTHRDIKPTNILLSSEGDVKWVDFGVAGLVERSGVSETYTTEQRTVDYAGLEKATGAPKGDPRSDVFYLGSVFYQMLTGESAMPETRDRQAKMLRTRFDNIKPLTVYHRDVPHRLAEIVDKMMAFQPNARYQDYAALLADLIECESGGAEGNGAISRSTPVRVIVVHKSTKVQEILRDALAKHKVQVVLTSDMGRAMTLFGHKPADCLIIDLETTGREGIQNFTKLEKKARGSGKVCGAVFIADESEKHLIENLDGLFVATALRPVTLGPVFRAVQKVISMVRPNLSNTI